MSEAFRCPTCRAPWRGVATCPRCGADLAVPMRVAARAWQLREVARAAWLAGDRPADALALARAACRLHATPRGQRLLAFALAATGRTAEARALLARLVPGGAEGGGADVASEAPSSTGESPSPAPQPG